MTQINQASAQIGRPKPFQIEITDFSGGMNTLDDPRKLKDNESPLLFNMDIVGKGAMQKRYGYDLVTSKETGVKVDGLLRFQKQNGDKFLLIFSEGIIEYITPASTTRVVIGGGGAYTEGSRIRGEVFNDLAIFGHNGVTTKKWSGAGNHTVLGGSPPQAGVFATNDRVLFLATGIDSIFWWSDLNNPEPATWGTTGISSNQDVGIGDGSNLRAMEIHNNNITIFKDFAKHKATPVFASSITDLDSFRPLGFATDGQKDKSDGTRSIDSIVHADLGTYFLGRPKDKGFQKYGLQENFPDRGTPGELANVISPTVFQINDKELARVAGAFWQKKYICSAPIGPVTINNSSFVYNELFRAWTLSSLSASSFAIFEDDKNEESLYFGSEIDNKVFKFNKKFYDEFNPNTGEGFAIQAIWRSKTYRPSNKNKFNRVIVAGKITTTPKHLTRFTTKVRAIGSKIDGKQFGKNLSFNAFITEDDVISEEKAKEYVGEFYVGTSYVGGSGKQNGMKDFFKVIDIPETINEGQEISFELENNRKGEGIQINYVILQGETLSDKNLP